MGRLGEEQPGYFADMQPLAARAPVRCGVMPTTHVSARIHSINYMPTRLNVMRIIGSTQGIPSRVSAFALELPVSTRGGEVLSPCRGGTSPRPGTPTPRGKGGPHARTPTW